MALDTTIYRSNKIKELNNVGINKIYQTIKKDYSGWDLLEQFYEELGEFRNARFFFNLCKEYGKPPKRVEQGDNYLLHLNTGSIKKIMYDIIENHRDEYLAPKVMKSLMEALEYSDTHVIIASNDY